MGTIGRLERLGAVPGCGVAYLPSDAHGRTCPHLDAELVFDPDEIRGAYLLTEVQQPATPRLHVVLRMIARVGGFLG